MQTKTTPLTKQQLKNWQAYERVRQIGRYNMFDSYARHATGLSEDRYLFVMKNYSDLKAVL